jgi:hypothetical protein
VSAVTVTVDDVVEYMGTADAARWAVVDGEDTTYPEITSALAAETAAQARRVTYPVDEDDALVDTPDLDEALKRRTVRNLAMRALPLSVIPGNLDAGTGPVRPGGSDPEIRRLETPYRRLVAG